MSYSHRALRNHMFQLRQHELDKLFSTLPSQTEAEDTPQGTYKGALMAIAGVQHLPRKVGALVYRLLSTPLNPWRGKTFSADEGANVWFSAQGYLRFGRFHSTSSEQGLELDYSAIQDDIPVNPEILRGIRGEARFLQNGVWLARMRWQRDAQNPSTRTTLLYFVLWQE